MIIQDRRAFIRTCSALGAMGVLTVTGIGCGQQTPAGPDYNKVSGSFDVNLNDHPTLRTVGSALSVDSADLGRPVIITHDSDGYHALDSYCTHAGCTVRASTPNLICPCHGSEFSLNGAVESGPAPTHLKRFQVDENGDVLTVTLG